MFSRLVDGASFWNLCGLGSLITLWWSRLKRVMQGLPEYVEWQDGMRKGAKKIGEMRVSWRGWGTLFYYDLSVGSKTGEDP